MSVGHSQEAQRIDAPGALEQRIAELERQVDHLRLGLESRTRIGVAVGILAERHDLTSDQAWSLLMRVAERTFTKVREVARILVAHAEGRVDPGDAETLARLGEHLPRLRPPGDVRRADGVR